MREREGGRKLKLSLCTFYEYVASLHKSDKYVSFCMQFGIVT